MMKRRSLSKAHREAISRGLKEHHARKRGGGKSKSHGRKSSHKSSLEARIKKLSKRSKVTGRIPKAHKKALARARRQLRTKM